MMRFFRCGPALAPGDRRSRPRDVMLEGLRSRRAYLDALPFADEVPVVLDLRTTWEGRIRVRRRAENLIGFRVRDQ